MSDVLFSRLTFDSNIPEIMSQKLYNIITIKTTLTIRTFISISKNFWFSIRSAHVKLFVFVERMVIKHYFLWIFNLYQTKKKNSLNYEKKGSFKKAFLVYKSYFRLSFFYSRNQRHISWIFLTRICRSNYSSLQGARCRAQGSA